MRAEVAAADPRGSAMTWYMLAVAAIEAAGVATAAFPPGSGGVVSGGLLGRPGAVAGELGGVGPLDPRAAGGWPVMAR
jgi:hypothetical protein